MRIDSVRIENFRSFEDATVPFNNYACLVGPNGVGKSTVLTALNVFFREFENTPTDLSQLEQEDFHFRNTAVPIRITVTFADLSEEAQDDFSDYVRQGKLVVTADATFNGANGKEVKQYGQRLGMTALRPFFNSDDCDLLSSFSCCGCHRWVDPDGLGKGIRLWETSKGPPALLQHVIVFPPWRCSVLYLSAEGDRGGDVAKLVLRGSRRGHAEVGSCRLAPAVGVQGEHLGLDALFVAGLFDETTGQRRVLPVCDHPADRVAAEGLTLSA